MTTTLPGALTAENKGAIDWRGGLVAYGVQHLVVVVEPDSVQLVQTLDGHTACDLSAGALRVTTPDRNGGRPPQCDPGQCHTNHLAGRHHRHRRPPQPRGPFHQQPGGVYQSGECVGG